MATASGVTHWSGGRCSKKARSSLAVIVALFASGLVNLRDKGAGVLDNEVSDDVIGVEPMLVYGRSALLSEHRATGTMSVWTGI